MIFSKSKKLQLLVDKKISHLKFFLEKLTHLVEVSYFEEIREVQEEIAQAQGLFVSSSCRLTSFDLKGSKISFIGSPTAGLNHIPQELWDNEKITIASAPGINRFAVTDYVLAVIIKYCFKNELDLSKLTVGVIGFGAIGGNLTKELKKFSINTVIYDPFVVKHSDGNNLAAMKKANIITFHVPLSFAGRHPTFEMVDKEYFKKILGSKGGSSLIINTSRGEIFKVKDLIAEIKKGQLKYAFDVWPQEPYLDDFLLEHSWLATPHIAGYSSRSKFLSSRKILLDCLTHFKIPLEELTEGETEDEIYPPPKIVREIPLKKIFFANKVNDEFNSKANSVLILEWLLERILNLEKTTRLLKEIANKTHASKKLAKKKLFLALRKKYLAKMEFSQVVVITPRKLQSFLFRFIKKLGMRVLEK